jgi:flagellar hook-associated protein 3 FlgL
MKTTLISTQSMFEATKLPLLKAQARLIEAQKEVTTGRHADVGRSLGFRTTQSVSLREEYARLTATVNANAIAATRLEVTQGVLQSFAADAQSFIAALTAARASENGPRIVLGEARTRLAALIDGINTTIDGASIFGGINTAARPLAQYFSDPPPASRQAVAAAFLGAFGIAQTDPAVAAISASDMQQFLDGAFSALTDPPAWHADWSSASDLNIRSRISTSELLETSANANADAVRKLVSAYAMVADLGVDRLNQAAFQAVVDTATRMAGSALQELTALQGNLGTAQERVTAANARISIQIEIMNRHIGALEGVDPYEASTWVTSLLSRIETAYALTARIQRLSLVNHLQG